MKLVRTLTLSVSVALCACANSPEQRGTVTIQGRGARELTQRGDPLMGTGKYAEKNVPKEFAMGYGKGISDQVKREYWAMQDEVSTRRADPAPSPAPQGSSAPGPGATHYYRVTLPESVDPDTGVLQAPRDVMVPINE